MASDQNPYTPPAAVDRTDSPAPKYIAWFVAGTLVGVVSASISRTSIQFVIRSIPTNPIRYATVYSVAAVVSAFVSFLGYNRWRSLNAKILDIVPRVVGGFALGFAPYHIDRVVAVLAPGLMPTIASLPPALVIPTSIAAGAVISVGVECGTRRVIRYLAQPKDSTNHSLHQSRGG